MTTLTEKELTIIDRISTNNGEITQRQIAQHTGLSLGLTNIILKRLTRKGYVKIRQLTPKKMHYILTPKGISEKTQKSYNYVFKTIREIRNINGRIQKIFEQEYQSGTKKIGIIGDNDLTEIIKIFSRDVNNIEIKWFANDSIIENIKQLDLIIDCRTENQAVKEETNPRTINLVDYITKSE